MYCGCLVERTGLDPGFRRNGEQLRAFVRRFRSLQTSGSFVKGVRIRAGASPEGSTSLNERLSRERAARLVDYLVRREGLERHLIETSTPGSDWEVLGRLVEVDPSVRFGRRR